MKKLFYFLLLIIITCQCNQDSLELEHPLNGLYAGQLISETKVINVIYNPIIYPDTQTLISFYRDTFYQEFRLKNGKYEHYRGCKGTFSTSADTIDFKPFLKDCYYCPPYAFCLWNPKLGINGEVSFESNGDSLFLYEYSLHRRQNSPNYHEREEISKWSLRKVE